MNQGTSNGQLKDRRPYTLTMKSSSSRQWWLNWTRVSMETILRPNNWILRTGALTARYNSFYLSEINEWETDHVSHPPASESKLFNVFVYVVYFVIEIYCIYESQQILLDLFKDQRIPFSHVFIHKFTYPNHHVSVRRYTWSSQVKNQLEKYFYNVKTKGLTSVI